MYSKSNVGKSSTDSVPKVQALTISFSAFTTCFWSSDSKACNKTFFFFYKNGLNFTLTSADGKVKSNDCVSNIGNSQLYLLNYINYKNGGNTLPPVALPIGKFLLAELIT